MKLFITFGHTQNAAYLADHPDDSLSTEVEVDLPEGSIVTYWGLEMQAPMSRDLRERCFNHAGLCGFVNIENCAIHGSPNDTPAVRSTILRQPLSQHYAEGRIHTMCGLGGFHTLADTIDESALDQLGDDVIVGMHLASDIVRKLAETAIEEIQL